MNARNDGAKVPLGLVAAAIQWVLLTFALGTMIIYTDRSLEGLLGFHLDSGYAFIGGLLVGFLMGATIERARALVPMVFFSCAGAAGVYVALLLYPTWTGKLVQTVGLENFATTRAILYFGLAAVPVSLGAMAGRLFGAMLPGGDLLRRSDGADRAGWWLDRAPADEAPGEATRSG